MPSGLAPAVIPVENSVIVWPLATPAAKTNNPTNFFISAPLFRLCKPAQAKTRHRMAEN
jgi:hypothetical protein